MSKRVLLLHTGGTLGMQPRDPDQALAPNEFASTVLEHVPELSKLAQIETRVLFNLDSSDLTPSHWMDLAEVIYDARDRFDGVVITHGTDAMAYTAAALSYVLRGLPFPVILTGSQRPLADVHTDGRANLVGAVDLALRKVCEVAVYFDGLLLRGNRAIKQSTFAFGAYASPNQRCHILDGGGERRVVARIVAQVARIYNKFDVSAIGHLCHSLVIHAVAINFSTENLLAIYENLRDDSIAVRTWIVNCAVD